MPPAPAVAAVRAAVRHVLLPEVPVLVACSGGADSLALAAATAFEADRAGVPAGLITIDHGLQPDASAQAQRVAAVGFELGLNPVLRVPVQVGTAGGPEAAARTARYAALRDAADSLGARVLLGHTLDDQAETVLLGLGRGSGPRSIVAMAADDGVFARPFLELRRETTEQACRALGLQPWLDPHNTDPRFQRVRLRREVLPLLDEVMQGGVAPALARTAQLLRDDLDALDAWAAQALAAARSTQPDADGRGALRVDVLQGLPRAVRTRVLRLWAAELGAQPLSAERTAALDALLCRWHGQGPIQLPGAVAVTRSRESGSETLIGYLTDTAPVVPPTPPDVRR